MTTLTDRFDPIPGKPYGRGEDGEIFATKEEADAYSKSTFEAAQEQGINHGKTVRVTNPGREARIRHFVSFKIEEALSEAMGELIETIDDGDVTAEEIRGALWCANTELEEIFDDTLDASDD